MSRLLITVGLALVTIGLLWPMAQKLGLGRLPGDIVIKRGNFSFYFPITTMVVVSVFLSAALSIISRLFGK